MGGGDGSKKSESAEESEATPVASSLVLEVVCDCMKVPTSPATVTVMAKLCASAGNEAEAEQGESRAPITLCAAIDRSDSMKEHLPLLKETLRFMIQQLRPRDQITLITFDDQVHVELPMTAMTADGKMRAEEAIARVKEGGRTNLSGGLLAALEALYRIKPSDASLVESVLLFTDGKANVGIRDQPTMTKATKSMLEQIDRQACVFTFGYGGEHDADLLHAVAEAGNGLFYYIDNSESIPESFCDCLGGLLSVVAQNVRLTFTASEEVILGRPLTSYRVAEKEQGKSYQVTIHDMYCEEERCILATATLSASPTLTDPTSVAVVTCKVEYFDVLGSKPTEGTATLSVVRNKSLERPIPSDAKDEIELHHIRCEVASTLDQAGHLANAGNIPAARQALVQVQGRVKGSVVAARPLAVHLQGAVQQSLEGLQDKTTFRQHGKAVMKNYAHSHWQQRSNLTPSQEGYETRTKKSVGGATPPSCPPPPSIKSAPPPYRNFAKTKLMAKHSTFKKSTS